MEGLTSLTFAGLLALTEVVPGFTVRSEGPRTIITYPEVQYIVDHDRWLRGCIREDAQVRTVTGDNGLAYNLHVSTGDVRESCEDLRVHDYALWIDQVRENRRKHIRDAKIKSQHNRKEAK